MSSIYSKAISNKVVSPVVYKKLLERQERANNMSYKEIRQTYLEIRQAQFERQVDSLLE